MAMVVFHASEETKAEKHVVLVNETGPYFMDKFEKIVSENNGYFVNGKVIINIFVMIYLILTLTNLYIYIYIYDYTIEPKHI